jgi:hypothetical protein
MNQQNGTEGLDDNSEDPIFPEVAWQPPQALDVITPGMEQCLSLCAADSKEVKVQRECAFCIKSEFLFENLHAWWTVSAS